MEVKKHFVFQVDSDIVNNVYKEHNNFIIEYNENAEDNYCIIYFSSNDLYYPNIEIAFKEQLIDKNRFEWYRTRIAIGKKHIFLRDVKKQWYLSGINALINDPLKLLDFLKRETCGFKIIAVGSSAGGFAAVMIGQQLNAERIYSFNGQFEINSLLQKSNSMIDPLVFRNKANEKLRPYFDTLNFIRNPETIYYFHSNKHPWDIQQAQQVKNLNLNQITFATGKHGIPFLKSNLPAVFNMPIRQLKTYTNRIQNPVIFSLKSAGVVETLKGLSSIYKYYFNKLYILTLLKLKTKFKNTPL